MEDGTKEIDEGREFTSEYRLSMIHLSFIHAKFSHEQNIYPYFLGVLAAVR